MSKRPVKAYIRLVYSDFSVEEQEISLETARTITEKDNRFGIDVGRCSKRVGNMLLMLSLVTDEFAASGSRSTGEESFSAFKKRVNGAIRDLAAFRSVTAPTIEDQLCRQCGQKKDELVLRVAAFFDAAKNGRIHSFFADSNGLYRHMVDNGHTSAKVKNFDEAEFMREKLAQLARRIENM